MKDMSKITEKQKSLLLRKLGSNSDLMEEEKDSLHALVHASRLTTFHASTIIENLFTLSTTTLGEQEKKAKDLALMEIRAIVQSYGVPSTQRCSRCQKESSDWFEQDEGMILCGSCRRELLVQTRTKKGFEKQSNT